MLSWNRSAKKRRLIAASLLLFFSNLSSCRDSKSPPGSPQTSTPFNDNATHHEGHATPLTLEGMKFDQPTHRAVQSGQWSDPSVWSTGQIPVDGSRIHIPATYSVQYDTETPARISWIYLEGTLNWATDRNTKLLVDTFVTSSQSQLLIGSAAKPLGQPYKAEIIFIDNGPINTAWDPTQLGRGLVALGKVEIFGHEKKSFVAASGRAEMNSTSVQLSQAPTSWQVGDKLVVAGTRWVGDEWNGAKPIYAGTQDEERVLTAVNGQTISLDRPLQFTHEAPEARFSFHVANLTRNIVFRSENGPASPTLQRGHIMFMHNANVKIYNAGFYDLGRTDKRLPIDDVGRNLDGTPGTGKNVRGRYALHLHKSGATEQKSTPAVIHGIAVAGSPGWGVVFHDSHAIVEDSASFDIVGSHYVSEDGQEIGAFRRNIAIKATGGSGRQIKEGAENHDTGHGGHGFWMQSRNMELEDNIAAGTRESGLSYFHRNYAFDVTVGASALLVPYGDILKFQRAMPYNNVPIWSQKRTTVYASGMGLHVVKANGEQDHDVRNIFESLHCWNVSKGLHIEYTQKYTFRDLILLADPGAYSEWNEGAILSNKVKSVVFDKARIQGFHTALVGGTIFEGQDDHTDGIFIDTQIMGATVNFKNPAPDRQIFLNGSSLVPGRLSFAPADNGELPDHVHFLPSRITWDKPYILSGTRTDSIWPEPYTSIFGGEALREHIKKGHYTCPDGGRCVVLTDIIVDRRTNEALRYKFLGKLPSDYFDGAGSNLGPAPQDLGARKL